MASSLADIISILAQIKLATVVAQQVGIAVPPVLSTFEANATAALEAVQGFEAPSSLTADLTDVAAAATALSGLASGPTISGVVAAIQKIPSTAADLAAGQLAVIALVSASFSGTADRVVVAAYRQSGDFARMVDSGTAD